MASFKTLVGETSRNNTRHNAAAKDIPLHVYKSAFKENSQLKVKSRLTDVTLHHIN